MEKLEGAGPARPLPADRDEILSVLLVGDYPADPTLGSAKVLYKLQAELRALGHRCEMLFDARLAVLAGRQMRQLLSPWLAGGQSRAA